MNLGQKLYYLYQSPETRLSIREPADLSIESPVGFSSGPALPLKKKSSPSKRRIPRRKSPTCCCPSELPELKQEIINFEARLLQEIKKSTKEKNE